MPAAAGRRPVGDGDPAPGDGVRRRPGGRTERVRRAVAGAVLGLLREQRFDLSVAEVADRAGVHRTTVYRRWPARADLLAMALEEFYGTVTAPDTGSWEGDVRALIRTLARFFTDPVEVGLVLLLALDRDGQTVTAVPDHWAPTMRVLTEIVDRAKARGEVDPAVESGRLVELLISPLVVYGTILHRRPSAPHLDQIAELVVRAGRP